MNEFFKTSIKDKKEFVFDGSKLKFVEFNPENNLYLYERFFDENGPGKGRRMGWEVVTPVNRKQPDGSTVECYPSSEQFGRYGRFYPPRFSREEMIKKIEL